jgi:hypothetical protein
MGTAKDISAGAGGEITDDGGLDVDARFHRLASLPRKKARKPCDFRARILPLDEVSTSRRPARRPVRVCLL